MMRDRLQQIPPARIRHHVAREQVDRLLRDRCIKRFGRMDSIRDDDESVALRDNISSPDFARVSIGHQQPPKPASRLLASTPIPITWPSVRPKLPSSIPSAAASAP